MLTGKESMRLNIMDANTTSSEPKSAGLTFRVLIVEDETLVSEGLRQNLERLGHTVLAEAANAADADAAFRLKQPDLVLMDIRLGSDDGISLASKLLALRACPIIIISAFSDKDLIDRAINAGVFGYLVKPVSQAALEAQIQLTVARFREHLVLVAEKQALAQSLENRKLIEKAKGIMMQRLTLSEADAHRKLQLESQNRRISVVELAKRIIDSEELLGGV